MLRLSCSLFAIALLVSSPCLAEETVKLGFFAPLTGELASFGSDGRRAAQIAVEEVNAKRLLGEKKLSVVFEDGRCAGKEGAQAASKLVRVDRVQAIVNAGCSSGVLSAAPIVEREKVVLLTSTAESADITHSGDYIFRISPNTRLAGANAANWMQQNGFKRVAVISENSDYALSLREVFVARLAELGLSSVEDATYNPEDSDFRVLLSRIRAKKPEAIFINPQTGLKGGLIAKQISELKWDVPLFGNYAFGLLDAAESAGGIKVLEGVNFVDYPVVTSEDGKKLIERFQDRFGAPQSDFNVAATYDAVLMLATAIGKVGYDGNAIKDYLNKFPEYAGAGFTYRFDKHGDAANVDYARKTIRDGKIVVTQR